MPYKVKNVDGGYQVVNKNTGKTYKKTPHKTKADAQKQMAAMYAHTKNEDMNVNPVVMTISDIADRLPDTGGEETIYYGVEDVSGGHDDDHNHQNDKCNMLVRNLTNIKEDTEFICQCICDGCEVEEWMKHKISICYAYLNDIADSLSSK